MVKVTPLLSLRFLAAALVLAPLLAGAALAQLPATDAGVSLQLDALDLSLGAGNATVVNGTVTNTGGLSGTVTLTLSIPEGWTVEVDPSSAFTLAAGASAPVTLSLAAPAAGAGELSGDMLLSAALVDQAGRAATPAEASLRVTRVDPIVPPPPPPPYDLYASFAILGVGVVVIGGLVWNQLRNERLARERKAAEEAARVAAHEAYLARETGIGISLVEGPVRFGTRRELVYRLQVENQSARDRVALVGVAQCPAGWSAACAIPKASLRPGERVTVTFHVNPGDAVPGGAKATLAFYAKPEEAQELDQRVAVEVAAPEVRVPETGQLPPAAPREPVAPRPVLRR